MASLHAVVMAGGSGTRFWPASRTRRPKQFLPLADGKPLIQATLDRLHGLCAAAETWIVTNRQQAKALVRLLPDFPRDHILVEPEPRDTGPCVALATATIAAVDASATMLVVPADHVIAPTTEFHRLVRRAVALAGDGRTLVTFGIEPTFPSTAYGYIEFGTALDNASPRACRTLRFREKPDADTARQFLERGGYWWNSGIFVWRVEAIRSAMAKGNAELARACDQMVAALSSGQAGSGQAGSGQAGSGQRGAVNRAFRQAPRISIDYAIMENAEHVVAVAAPIRWDDVGSFPALAAIAPPDVAGNSAVLSRKAALVALQARRNIVYAEGKRTVALFGVDDLVVVAVGDAVMVCPKNRAHELKQLVDHLRSQGRADLL